MNTFSIGDIFKTAWAQLKAHIGFLSGSTFVFLVLTIILNSVNKHASFWSFLITIASLAISLMFSIGMIKIAFTLHDGGIPTTKHFYTDMTTFWRYVWGIIIVGFFAVIGLVLLVIPGIIVIIRLSFVKYLIIDKKMQAWQAVKESWRMTKGYSWKIFWFTLAVLVIVLISLIPFGLGLLLSIPFVSIATVKLYKKVSVSLVPVSVSPIV